MNSLFTAALSRKAQKIPPIWMMRQAGRYHQHYQRLREKHSFLELCKKPELAAEVAFGPVDEFDFDVAILFSDILFPLEALGMGLDFGDYGPKLGWQLTQARLSELRSVDEALPHLEFQREAMKLTRQRIPASKSLIGFVGGPWTLFSYAVQGRHDGTLIDTKKSLGIFSAFCERIIPLLIKNIQLQFDGGAELVMLFDTAAGELSPALFNSEVVPQLKKLFERFSGKLGYYSKSTQKSYFKDAIFNNSSLIAGVGFDHHWDLAKDVFAWRKHGFIQGNFDQALLHLDATDFEKQLRNYLQPILELTPEQRCGWICGLGHGVLPKTPEANVKRFVNLVREMCARN